MNTTSFKDNKKVCTKLINETTGWRTCFYNGECLHENIINGQDDTKDKWTQNVHYNQNKIN